MGDTILVVDDELSDRNLMGVILRAHGHIVLEGGDSYQAFGLFRQHEEQITMVVTDIALPGENGCEMAARMVKGKPDLIVLFVSGHTGAEICRFYGFPVSDVHFLRKPFGAGEFIRRVHYLLDRAESLPEKFSAA
jgi:DNA-binding response OmpR family regulator